MTKLMVDKIRRANGATRSSDGAEPQSLPAVTQFGFKHHAKTFDCVNKWNCSSSDADSRNGVQVSDFDSGSEYYYCCLVMI